ncbi:MAG: holin-like protein [Paracoccaceae bacterium]|jgi:holin-like protein
MIFALSIILACQLAGEGISRALDLPLPGPVIGMLVAIVIFAAVPKLFEAARPTATYLLSHLSLLFVPAGVGIVGHLDVLGSNGPAILLSLLISTALAITVGAATFRLLSGKTQQEGP